jgi:hypothetical protein
MPTAPHLIRSVPGAATLRRKTPPSVVVFDPRRYRQRRGQLLMVDRVYVGPMWTPLVRVRLRQLRASDGATEL